jgi:DNA-binding NtrC family response regulator
MTSPYTLLIAEDEEMLRELIVDALSELGCRILEAPNGSEALEILKKQNSLNKISAVLTDINMPLFTGFDFMEKAREAGFETPFVFLTAYGDKENVVKALRLGAFDFLEKPFDPEILRSVVAKAMELGHEFNQVDSSLESLAQELKIPDAKKDEFIRSRRAIEKLKIENRNIHSKRIKKAS